MQYYMPHAYKIKLPNRVNKLAERAYIIDPVARANYPGEFKGVVSEIVDFASDIHAKQNHETYVKFIISHMPQNL